MMRYPLKAALLAGTLLAVAIPGAVWATGSSGKTQDRLPQSQIRIDDDLDRPLLLAELPPPPNGAPWPASAMTPQGGPPRHPMGSFPPRLAQMGPSDPRPLGPPPGPHGGPSGDLRDDPMGGPRGQLRLAEALAAAETAIGIRGEQIDAWRDFTDALQATLAPPPPPPAPTDGEKDKAPPAAFALASEIAAHGKATGEAAGRLAQAIASLKARLSPDQLKRLAQIEPSLLPPPPPPPGGRPPGPQRG